VRVGKPTGGFFEPAVDDLRVQAAAATTIADYIDTDTDGAIAARLAVVLVGTGKYRDHGVRDCANAPTAPID
jgi:ribonucleotide monophosphatase NagD (HAD superfamily)